MSLQPIEQRIKQQACRAQAETMQRAIKIMAFVAETYDLPVYDLMDRTRKQPIAEARQVAMYLIRVHCKLTNKQTGALLGGRHHTDVMHACSTVFDQTQINPKFAARLQTIQQHLN